MSQRWGWLCEGPLTHFSLDPKLMAEASKKLIVSLGIPKTATPHSDLRVGGYGSLHPGLTQGPNKEERP